ncbi:MAG: hypothetical protein Q9211_006490, partial [Gyalolechia sp. 1 TL-2023]
MAASALLLFGPVSPRPSQAYLSQLQTSITERGDHKFLVELIQELPDLWPTILQASPQLHSVRGAEQLDQLNPFLATGTLPDAGALSNLVAAPLTVISHISEVLSQSRDSGQVTIPALDNVQGFCIGFLTAAALATSRDTIELRQYASVAVRLALCIGAVIDLDEASFNDPSARSTSIAVRWKSNSGKHDLEMILKQCPTAYISCATDRSSATVTIPSREERSFTQQLVESGMLVQSIGLRGRYHHPDNIGAVRQLKDLCTADKRFQLPTADRLVLPLRSNFDAGLITKGALHDIALDSILVKQSHWFQTVKTAVADLEGKKIKVINVGIGSVSPRSLRPELSTGPEAPNRVDRVNTVASSFSEGTPVELREFLHDVVVERDLPVESSYYPTPSVESDQGPGGIAFGASPIAVVGMACRFPEADTLEQFWQLIATGSNAVQPIPRERFNVEGLWREPKGPFWGNFLRDPDAFDHRFFSISGREAKSMDPQQRLLLQVVYEAMESSGYFGLQRSATPKDIGCYVGVGSVDYEDNVCGENATAFSALGTLRAFISGRALRSGECSMAVAGGVNVITSPKLFQNLGAGGFLSPTGASKAFDANANGYCRGEGAGIVVLKPLERAVADCDTVLGVIAGSAVNQGSNCTPVGDPIECESIRQTFGGPHREEQLFLGSVKDNVGHAEAASGAAGIIKVLLMMQHRRIPKQANFLSLNPTIPPLGPDQMRIPQQTQLWDAHRRNAVVNNYGAAGSNVALVLKEHCTIGEGAAGSRARSSLHNVHTFPFTIMAKSPESLRTYCAALKSFVASAQEASEENLLANVAYNLATKQNRSLNYCLNLTASNVP